LPKIYAGAKSFAMKGQLLEKATLEKLAESSNIEELVNRLKTTPYSEYLSQISPPYYSRKLELAFRARLAEAHFSLMQSTNSKLVELFYLKRIGWDLKTVLKSKALNKSYEETIEFVDMRAEELVGRRDLIVRVLSAKDLQESLTLLSGTEFYDDVEKSVSAYLSTKELRVFDTYIDHAILSQISKEFSSHRSDYSSRSNISDIESMIALEIDSYNVLTVLRAKVWKLQESEVRSLVITPTYNVSMETLDRMITSESVDEAVRLLPEKYSQETTQKDEEGIIDEIEQKFRKEGVRIASRAFLWQGLGLAVVLAFIKLLENEVNNLSAISVGVESGLESKRILSNLLFATSPE
jgi:V/A-type H+-transporting ATPase subunit C